MKALFLVTYTLDCEKNWKSWQCIGNECFVEVYDNRPHDRHDELVTLAHGYKPDVIVYIGAIEKYHKRPVPKPDILKRLRDVAPSIHICGDASDKPWWEWLHKYDMEECFSVQVSIDGNFDTPIADMENGIVKLTPTDPTPFVSPEWEFKGIQCGMAGGLGHGERMLMINALITSRQLDWRKNLPFHEMASFMGSCKLIVNSPVNGTGDSVHVKGRVIEAAWAGACLLERENECTSRWFPDDLYLRYKYPVDASKTIEWARQHDEEVASMAKRFHEHVRAKHHPRVFWNDVLAKAGVFENVRY